MGVFAQEGRSRKRSAHVRWLLHGVALTALASASSAAAQGVQTEPQQIEPARLAQNVSTELPPVTIERTRLAPGPRRPSLPAGPPARRRTTGPTPRPTAAPAPAAGPATVPAQGTAASSPGGIVSGTIITGASSSVISSADIERSPNATLQDILAREPGIQISNLFGAVNGAQTTVDMRGFGATGTQNALVLVNGRRLNDLDLSAIDFSAIPRNSIDRIEVTRGNSGAVLYGDGAVGGVINIITKSGVDLPPSGRVQATVGSFRYYEAQASASGSWQPLAPSISSSTLVTKAPERFDTGSWGVFSSSVYGNAVSSHGYRDNNQLRQYNGVADLHWSDRQGSSAYLTIGGDQQHLGLPGARRVTPTVNEFESDPRGAATPRDFANKEGSNVVAGVSRELLPGTQVIVDGGIRQKNSQSGFFSSFDPSFDSSFKATLTTGSLTPRLSSQHNVYGMDGKLLAGIDFYDTTYGSERGLHQNDPPIHRYDLTQQTVAGYAQETVALLPTTDFSVGGRVQRNETTARDRVNFVAPGAAAAFPVEALPFKGEDTQWAGHVGLEHRLTPYFAVFGRAARSFRLPTVDERIGSSPFGLPSNFTLRTQTSHDVEGGARFTMGRVVLQSSVYDMQLKDELFFSPATFTDVNLSPTHRYGVETIGAWQATDTVRFKGGFAYTRSVFRQGPFAGNDVPLVSHWTGSAGVTWDIWGKALVFDGSARFFSEKHMDNDSANQQVLIPGKALVDVRLGGQYQQFIWSIGVQNLFNGKYYEYAISSLDFATGLPRPGFYNVYPLPGRVVQAKAGIVW